MPGPLVTSALVSGGATILGGLLGRKKSRPDYAGQLDYLKKSIPARVEGAKAAGLHPLAALGIAPAGQPAMIPGQSDTGSIIGEGIQAAGRAYGQAQARDHALKIAELDLENRRLQNDWLQSQIAASNQKTLESQAISYPEAYRRLRLTRDPKMMYEAPTRSNARAIPLPPEGQTYITSDGDVIQGPPGSPARLYEEDIGDWSQWMPDTVTRAWQIFKDQSMAKWKRGVDKWIDRHRPYFPKPRPYKGKRYTSPEYHP